MKTIDNILVPVDFTDISLFGVKASARIAKDLGANVHFAHFLAPSHPISGLSPEAAMGQVEMLERQQTNNKNQALIKLKGVMDKYIHEDNRGTFYIVPSALNDNFDSLCEKAQIDMVISGTSGSRGLLEWVVGNRTENMIRKSGVPVLAVSDDQEVKFNNVMIATDLSQDVPKHLYEFCKKLSNYGTTIHLANVITDRSIAKEDVIYKLNAFANSNGLTKFRWHIIYNDDALTGLLNAIDDIKPDVLLMKTYEQSGFWSIFSGSLAEKVIRSTNVPAMVETV